MDNNYLSLLIKIVSQIVRLEKMWQELVAYVPSAKELENIELKRFRSAPLSRMPLVHAFTRFIVYTHFSGGFKGYLTKLKETKNGSRRQKGNSGTTESTDA